MQKGSKKVGFELYDSLPKEQLYDYVKKAEAGDKGARELVILHNVRLVLSRINKRFLNSGEEVQDLISIGLIGLMKGLDSYDSSRNIAFSTYVAKCIDNEILMHFRSQNKSVHAVSLDKPCIVSEDQEVDLYEILSDDSPSVEEQLEEKDVHERVRQLVENLPEKERKIVKLRYGFDDNKVHLQSEIGSRMNVTQTYISKILKKTTKGLKSKMVYLDNTSSQTKK